VVIDPSATAPAVASNCCTCRALRTWREAAGELVGVLVVSQARAEL
jgi:hypothetical protein